MAEDTTEESAHDEGWPAPLAEPKRECEECQLARAVSLLRRWRRDGAVDHRLPLETANLLTELGEEL